MLSLNYLLDALTASFYSKIEDNWIISSIVGIAIVLFTEKHSLIGCQHRLLLDNSTR